MVLAIKDDENKFDMMVRNCVAHDGKRTPIQLVDERGCVTRPKIMGRFQKVKNFGSSASVVSYAYFKAFKFPEHMNVHFQCVIQVCRYNCPEPQCGGIGLGYQGAGSETRTQVIPNPDPRLPAHASALTAQSKEGLSDDGNVSPVHGDTDQPIPYPLNVHLKGKNVNFPVKPEGYPKVNRQGSSSDIPGRPRALNHDDIDIPEPGRDRRSASSHVYRRAAQEMTDVSTARVIQVVAPGDVAFNLNAANETVVTSEPVDNQSNICMSATGFTAGLVMMLLVLTIACLVACFLYTRVRAFNAKGSVTTFVQGYDNPEFVKVAGGN